MIFTLQNEGKQEEKIQLKYFFFQYWKILFVNGCS